MIRDHDTAERIARQMCDERNGSGHFDKARTQRNHWRKKASRLLAMREESKSPHLLTNLMRALGWQV